MWHLIFSLSVTVSVPQWPNIKSIDCQNHIDIQFKETVLSLQKYYNTVSLNWTSIWFWQSIYFILGHWGTLTVKIIKCHM